MTVVMIQGREKYIAPWVSIVGKGKKESEKQNLEKVEVVELEEQI